MKKVFALFLALVIVIGAFAQQPLLPVRATTESDLSGGAAISPYLQQLPEDFSGCSNLYGLLTPVKGYYTATKYDTSNGQVLSVVIPVEPGDRIAASSFGAKAENMGSVNGIRVTYLLLHTLFGESFYPLNTG